MPMYSKLNRFKYETSLQQNSGVHIKIAQKAHISDCMYPFDIEAHPHLFI